MWDKCDVVFIKRPLIKKQLLGLRTHYQGSTILYDITEDFFRSKAYEKRKLNSFDLKPKHQVNNLYSKKTQKG